MREQQVDPIAQRLVSSPPMAAAVASSNRRIPATTSPSVTSANPSRARPSIARSSRPIARPISIPRTASRRAVAGSFAQRMAFSASRSASQPCSRPGARSSSKTMGALEPAIGNRRLGADAQVVPGQPDCDPGRRARIVTLPVERIGPLTGGEAASRSFCHQAASARPSQAAGVSSLTSAAWNRVRAVAQSPRSSAA